MNLLALTRKDLLAAPVLPWDKDTVAKGVIILPVRKPHESGYSLFSLVLWKGQELIGRTPACSDVLHIEGIGGYGLDNFDLTKRLPVVGWSIDILPKAKCICLWCRKNVKVTDALSSISVYSTDEK